MKVEHYFCNIYEIDCLVACLQCPDDCDKCEDKTDTGYEEGLK